MESRLSEIKARLDRMQQRMADEKAELSCERCRWYFNNFSGYSRERKMCVNPAVRALSYEKKRVPKRVREDGARQVACGRDSLLFERRRPWDGLRIWDAAPFILVVSVAAIFLLRGSGMIVLGVALFAITVTSAVGSLMWLIACLAESRWTRPD